MSKVFHFKDMLPALLVVLASAALFSCSGDDDDKLDNGSNNTIDVAVTSNLSKLGITYAHIDGFVNLNLITAIYTSQQVGIELSMNEDFDNPKRAVSKELEGNKLTVVIDTLSAQTKYFYRTFVKVNDLSYYGEKRSFTTKDFSNITSTGSASELTFTSAKIKCNGDASSIDKENNYAIGVAYSTSKTRLHPDSAYIGYDPYYGYYSRGFNVVECSLDSIIKNKSYEKTISRLLTGTTYYYCSFTRAGKKCKLGEIKSFTTKALSEAQLSTGDATDITFTSATIRNASSIASMYPKGTSIQYGVRYGVSQDALYETAYASSQEGEAFTVQLRNLVEGKTYYYCAYVSVDGVSLTGNTKSFTTKSGNSYLTTEDATDITLTSATLKGKTTLSSLYGNNESSIRYTIRYSSSSNNIINQYGYNYETTNPQKNGNDLTATLSSLQMNTTYYFCVVAYVDGYYVFGDVKSFRTKSVADYLTTGNASDITLTSATLSGTTTLSTIYPNNTSIQYSIKYGTSRSNLNSTVSNVLQNGNNLSGTVSNLKSGTTYYYRVSAYVGGTAIYGMTKSFTTKSGTDYLATDAASNITMTSATIKGTTLLASVYPDNTIQYMIVYSTSESSLISSSSSSNSSSIIPELKDDSLIAELSNLDVNTTYYYCVRAKLNSNYYYGDIKRFTTKDLQQSGAVDLGLSCLWSACNLGASSPDRIGNYYAWGEIETKESYTASNYLHTKEYLGKSISSTQYDAAYKKLGSPWRMPTTSDFGELIQNCNIKRCSYKSTYGILVSAKNGNAIFVPEAKNTRIYCWTATYYVDNAYPGLHADEEAYAFERDSFFKYGFGNMPEQRYSGLPIRPVCNNN